MVWAVDCVRCHQVSLMLRYHDHLLFSLPFCLLPLTNVMVRRTLVSSFPEAGLGVSVAVDSVIYQSDVFAASHSPLSSPRRARGATRWGDRAVLILIGIRLGLDGVNPIYYDTIKVRPIPPLP